MTRWMVALLALAACKERGTIHVPLVEPCPGGTLQGVAVYLSRDQSCGQLSCPVAFDCTAPDCIALCADHVQSGTPGYCTPDELTGLTVQPPSAGEYSLVLGYRYAGDSADRGLVCFSILVDADGTQDKTVPLPTDANQGANLCCTSGP